MLAVLLDSPVALALTIFLLAVLNHFLGTAVLKAQRSQNFVEMEEFRPPGPVGKVRGWGRFALPLLTIVPVCVLVLLFGRFGRELIGGGYLVLELGVIAINAGTLLTARSLTDTQTASGHIRVSASYMYRVQSGALLSMAFFAGVTAALLSSMAFAMGALLSASTAAGYYRRSRQAARAAAIATPA